jgi:hypothetical protein
MVEIAFWTIIFFRRIRRVRMPPHALASPPPRMGDAAKDFGDNWGTAKGSFRAFTCVLPSTVHSVDSCGLTEVL